MFTIIDANPQPRTIDPTLRTPISFHPIRALRAALAARRPTPESIHSARQASTAPDLHRVRAEFDHMFRV